MSLHFLLRHPLRLLALLPILVVGMSALPLTVADSAESELAAVWQRVHDAGSYEFSADMSHLSIPASSPDLIGYQKAYESQHMEGSADLSAGSLSMRVWNGGGSVLRPGSAVEVQIEQGETRQRRPGEAWQTIQTGSDLFAPGGDLLGFLNAIRDVVDHGWAVNEGPLGDRRLRRYTFAIDGATYARHLRDEFTRQERVPASVQIDLPHLYVQMVGTGEIWIDERGLPVRQSVSLDFPDTSEHVRAHFEVNFREFGEVSEGAIVLGNFWTLPALSIDWDGNPSALLTFFFSSALLVILLRRRRLRYVNVIFSVTMAFTLVLTPLLQQYEAAAFHDRQAVKRAVQEEERLVAEEMEALDESLRRTSDPHLNRLEQARSLVESSPNEPGLPEDLAFYRQRADDGTGLNSDADSLTDYQESLLGTNPNRVDSDTDLLPDDKEVQGIEVGGQQWYLDPLAKDSNQDGLADTFECTLDGQGDLSCPDGDNDGTPDVFDTDNDGDGVLDGLDISPFSASSQVFDETDPLGLQIQGLDQGKRIYVDVQLRPEDPDHLWYAFNALDWPYGDRAGQMQDWDAGTFDNDYRGDVQLVPMLELRYRATDSQMAPESEREFYGISERALDPAAQERAAYIPLDMVVDPVSKERQAFHGRILLNAKGSWLAPHDLRMVWVVEGLVDSECDLDTLQCDQLNQRTVLHAYPESWVLTGLSVREDHGVRSAIVYEDPAVDNDRRDDSSLILLSLGLQETFLIGADRDDDGQIDVDVDAIAERFQGTAGGGDTSSRWDIPGQLRVERFDDSHLDQMLVNTATARNVQILNERFGPFLGVEPNLSPTLLVAREETYRATNLNQASVALQSSHLQWSDRNLLIDFADDEIALETVHGVSWAPYRYSGTDANWQAYPIQEYAEEIPNRPSSSFSDETDRRQIGPKQTLFLLYYIALYQGVANQIRVAGQLVPSESPAPEDSAIAEAFANATFGFSSGAAVAVADAFSDIGTLSIVNFYGSINNQNVSLGDINHSWLNQIEFFDSNPRFSTGVSVGLNVLLTLMIAFGPTLLQSLPSASFGRISLTILIGGALFATSVVGPLLTMGRAVKAAFDGGLSLAQSVSSTLTSSAQLVGASRVGASIGLAVQIIGVWVLFAIQVGSAGISIISDQAQFLAAQAVAGTIIAVYSFLFALTLPGLIIVSIVGVIDFFLTALGSEFTISGALTNFLSRVIYASDTTVASPDSDDIRLLTPDFQIIGSGGYVAGNSLRLAIPIETTLRHRDPDETPRLWASAIPYVRVFYTKNKLKSSEVTYRHTNQDGAVDVVANSWTTRREGKFLLTPLYSATSLVEIVTEKPLTRAGINQGFDHKVRMSFDFPGFRCYVIPFPAFASLLVPVCVNRRVTSPPSTDPNGLFNVASGIEVDVFPTDLESFWGWDWIRNSTRNPQYRIDLDGDRLNGSINGFQGHDPDDTNWDSDGDGVTDYAETISFVSRRDRFDTDGDGLHDGLELRIGSKPNRADSDGDGLTDREEYEGYLFTYDNDAGLTVLAQSNWLLPDSDFDGISDARERELHLLDPVAFPYHPEVWNRVAIGIGLSFDNPDGVYGPGEAGMTAVVANHTLAQNGIYVNGTVELARSGFCKGENLSSFNNLTSGDVQEIPLSLTIEDFNFSETVAIDVCLTGSFVIPAGATEAAAALEDVDIIETFSIFADREGPIASFTLPDRLGLVYAPGNSSIVIGGTTDDDDVDFIDVRETGGAWQRAAGRSAWTYLYETGDTTRCTTFEVRATDFLGNSRIANSGPLCTDAQVPEQSHTYQPDQIVGKEKNQAGEWIIPLRGGLDDEGNSGLQSLDINIAPYSNGWQTVDFGLGRNWSADYVLGSLDAGGDFDPDPSGPVVVTTRVYDRAGNESLQEIPLIIDASGAHADLLYFDGEGIDDLPILYSPTLSGLVTQTSQIQQVGGVEIAIVAETTDEPATQWSTAQFDLTPRPDNIYPWSYPLPSDLEGFYRIDVRGIDGRGSIDPRRSEWTQWRGLIDNLAPRLNIEKELNGFGTGAQTRFSIRVDDLNLVEENFASPCGRIQERHRRYSDDPILRENFPDSRQLAAVEQNCTVNGAIHETPLVSACDLFGRCTTNQPTIEPEPANKIYWTETTPGSQAISRANLDGSEREELLSTADGLEKPTHLALDVGQGHLYWSEPDSGRIRRADLADGGSPSDFLTPAEGLQNPWSIDFHPQQRKLFWTDYGAGMIRKANVDGAPVVEDVKALDSPCFRGALWLFSALNQIYYACQNVMRRVDTGGGSSQNMTKDLPNLPQVGVLDIAVDIGRGNLWRTGDVTRTLVSADFFSDWLELSPFWSDGHPFGLAAETEGGDIYFTTNSAGEIRQADQETGRNGAQVVLDGLAEPRGLHIDYNHKPKAVDKSALAWSGVATPLTLAGLDPDGDILTYRVTEPPTSGSLSGSGANLSYTSQNGYTGPDLLRFEVADTRGVRSTGVYSISVIPMPLVTSAILSPTDGISITLPSPPIVFSGAAYAGAGLKSLSVMVDRDVVYTEEWAQGSNVSETNWSMGTGWAPTGGIHSVTSVATDWAGNTQTKVSSITVLVDGDQPTVSLERTNYSGRDDGGIYGTTTLSGTVNDDTVDRVEVRYRGGSALLAAGTGSELSPWLPAVVSGTTWTLPLPLFSLSDGTGTEINVRVRDSFGNSTTVTETITIDNDPPAAVDVTMSFGGAELVEGDVLRHASPLLRLDWTASSDGAGLAGYHAGWSTDESSPSGLTQTPNLSYETNVAEPAQVYAHVIAEDSAGNQTTTTNGPIIVDSPTTPDLILPLSYDHWQSSGCSLIGEDNPRWYHGKAGSTELPGWQRLYMSWNGEGMRLTWKGADWNSEGDLFIYLDTTGGGATQLYDPYGNGPPIALPNEQGAMGADYLIHVTEADSASLLSWNGSDWNVQRELTASEMSVDYVDPEISTDIYIAFADLGIANPATSPLGLLALASHEESLSLWSSFPSHNPLNSAQLLSPEALLISNDGFQLLSAYRFDNLGDGACPEGSVGSRDTSFDITSTPEMLQLGYLKDGYFSRLTLDQPLDPGVDGAIDPTVPTAPASVPLLPGETVNFSLTYTGGGTGATFEADWYGAFGNGTTIYALDAYSGTVEFSRNVKGAGSAAEMVGTLRNPQGEIIDGWWSHGAVDRSGPTGTTLARLPAYLPPGKVVINGQIQDQGGVAAVEVETNDGGRATTRCSAGDPFDGRWSCSFTLNGSEGSQITIRVRGEDRAGNVGDWSTPATVIVDGTAPTLSLSSESQSKLAGPLNPRDLTLSGTVEDNQAPASLEYCVDQTIRCTQIDLLPGGSTSASWRISPLLESSGLVNRTLYLTAIDQAGNRSAPASFPLVIDIESPTIAAELLVSQIELGKYQNGDGSPILSGTVIDSGGVETSEVYVVGPNGTGTRQAIERTGNGWSFTPTLTQIGTHQFTVEIRDRAGNLSVAGPYQVEVVDTVRTLALPLIGRKAGTPITRLKEAIQLYLPWVGE